LDTEGLHVRIIDWGARSVNVGARGESAWYVA
jgi:hypothetical protein